MHAAGRLLFLQLYPMRAGRYQKEEQSITKVDDLLAEFADELLDTHRRYAAFLEKAEKGGQPQHAKYFRAIVVSETAREERYRCGMAHHAREEHDYYVYPHCGLVFLGEALAQCPVDETGGTEFTKIDDRGRS